MEGKRALSFYHVAQAGWIVHDRVHGFKSWRTQIPFIFSQSDMRWSLIRCRIRSVFYVSHGFSGLVASVGIRILPNIGLFSWFSSANGRVACIHPFQQRASLFPPDTCPFVVCLLPPQHCDFPENRLFSILFAFSYFFLHNSINTIPSQNL